jgi:hypothetical protein
MKYKDLNILYKNINGKLKTLSSDIEIGLRVQARSFVQGTACDLQFLTH